MNRLCENPRLCRAVGSSRLTMVSNVWHFLAIIVVIGVGTSALELDDACMTPDNKPGFCTNILSCPDLNAMKQKSDQTADIIRFLRSSDCQSTRSKSNVCCTNRLVAPLEAGDCGIPGIVNRVYGGKYTGIDEFPWMALIEYKRLNNDLTHGCGGSLISNRYVLTAAHCVHRKMLNGMIITRVRLGEWDTSTVIDCIDTECAPMHIDVEVEQQIIHHQYTADISQTDDIALLRLAQSVRFTDFVKPICLPVSDDQRRNVVNTDDVHMTAAGWGRTETRTKSMKCLKVNMIGVSRSQCSPFYSGLNVRLGSGQLCAGGIAGQDTCNGDSGGPLMLWNRDTLAPHYTVAGVVSLGPATCGSPGIPGVYTRVHEYIEWIKLHMREH